MQKIDDTIAQMLLEIGAIQFNAQDPFTYTSGMKSPIYCDVRKAISNPFERDAIVGALIDAMRREIGLEKIQAVSGTATAGIPLASWLADRLHMPMVYVRSEEKKHGLKNKIEGVVKKGDHVLVVEDIVSSGKSSANNIESVREAGARVDYCLAVASYDLPEARKVFKKLGVTMLRLAPMRKVIDVAVATKLIGKQDKRVILAWLDDPWGWSGKLK